MNVVTALGGIGAAFGLASSAGLNAYIPLLIVALAARFPLEEPLLQLAAPYDLVSSWWSIGLITVLLLVEMTVDKIPAVDTVNDVIQTAIRPAAGALLFAANAEVVTEISPVLALAAGLVLAGGVHATKATVRPAVTAGTAGTGNWFVSLLEDLVAVLISVLSVLIPIVVSLLLIILFATIIAWFIRRRRRRLVSHRSS
ncbi:MAG: DUF4126 domain-containing protein [Anaerolineae bacterium]|nr:DUF4126 domain-containing protein [Anaerolineae bacterium]